MAAALAATTAFAQPATPPAKAQACAACHGIDGNSTMPLTPVLAGQTARYLYLQLRDFQEGRRSNELMSPMAAGLTRDEMRELADWFARQAPKPTGFKPDPEKARLGKLKADETLCTMCHLGGFAGQNEIPRVAGQQHDYIVKQLTDFKQGKRTNDAGNMTSVARTLNEKDIENLANYLSGL
ncbi:MAG: c-type cytochrome [Ramlibacter sp.]